MKLQPGEFERLRDAFVRKHLLLWGSIPEAQVNEATLIQILSTAILDTEMVVNGWLTVDDFEKAIDSATAFTDSQDQVKKVLDA